MNAELNIAAPVATTKPATGTTGNIDFNAIKQRQQATWASGDFAIIGTTLQIVGESLAEAVDLRAGERVLDVAAGNGNATLAAARRFAHVTSTDYVPHLLETKYGVELTWSPVIPNCMVKIWLGAKAAMVPQRSGGFI